MSAFNRPLRPKTHSNSDSLSPTRNSLPPVPLVSRAANTKQACNLCRHKKIKCDGRRPICSRCNRAGATCTYVVRRSTLQGLSDDLYGTIYDLLHSVPSSDVTELLEAFRQELTQEALSSPNGELSIQPLLSGLLAPTGNTLEFELMTRHPVSYPQLFPLQLASLPLDSLLTPATWALRASDDSSSSYQLLPQNTQSSSSLRPLADQRLQKLDISKWTKVVISNELAASIISLYIETDYRILPLFDLDLFIGDLVQLRTYFCSDLLLNSLLSWACAQMIAQQTYTAIDPKAHVLSQAFFNEARNLLPQGPELNTLTAVSALTMLSIAAMGYGMDPLAFRFLQEGISVGMRMGLFDDGSAHKSASAWLGDHEDWSRCASYTAWGVHNWVSLYRLRYRNLEIDVMPKVPMPKKSPLSSDTEIFLACSELWLISNDIVKRSHSNSNSTYSAFSPKHDLIESMFRRLLAWADALPLRLVRSDQCNYAVLMMHIYFHVIVVDLFRYHLTTTRDNARLSSFSTLKATPRAAYAASINQLKRLLLMCRLSAETGRFSILSQTVLIYVCNAVVREAQNSHQLEWHLYLRLCLTALEDLYGCYQESWTVTQGLMSMAMKHGAMTPEEAQRITNEMIGLGQHHSAHGGVDTQSIVDLDLAITDPIAATGASLAGQFEEQVLQGQREEPASGDRSSM